MGREFNYSKTITTFGFAGYLGFRTIPFIVFGMMNSLKFKVVWKRVSEVLNMEEFNKSGLQSNLDKEIAIQCSNVDASWGFKIKKDIYSGETQFSDNMQIDLTDITFSANKSDLIAVVGPVGCGKSTLLALIMRELLIQRGDLQTRGKMWYVEQEPYILSETIKQNILFGSPFDEQKFESKFDKSKYLLLQLICRLPQTQLTDRRCWSNERWSRNSDWRKRYQH